MALHRMGLGAEFSLNVNPAVKSANKARASIGKLKQGLTQLGLATTPVAIAFGAAAITAGKYEQQLSAVQSVTGATTAQMKSMSRQAKMLALDTKFSHIEAAEGMEVLSRAGFEQTEMLAALRPVMDAAAADNISMATSADIVASAIRSMNLEASDAGRVSDVLASASANSNTNITLLGESMRYAAAQAKTAGIDLETTVAAIGALGDSGLKGSIAGTSFANMLVKMAKPTQKGSKLMDKYEVKMLSLKDGTVDVIGTMKQFGPALEKIPLSLDKAAFIAEVFGIRGQKAVNALLNSIEKGRFEKLHAKLLAAEGTAKRMAEIRLDNFLGQWTKLRKSVGVFSTQLFGPFLESAKDLFKDLHGWISKVLKASVAWEKAVGTWDEELVRKKYGVFLEIALGIKDAGETMAAGFKKVRTFIEDVGRALGKHIGKDGARKTTKYIILFGAFLAILPPLAIAVTGLSMAFGGLGTALSGLGITPVIANLKRLITTLVATRYAASKGAMGSAAMAPRGLSRGDFSGPKQRFGRTRGAMRNIGYHARTAGGAVAGAANKTFRHTIPRSTAFGGAMARKRTVGSDLKAVGRGMGKGFKKMGLWITAFFTKLPGLIAGAAVAIKAALIPALAAIWPVVAIVAGVLASIMVVIAAMGHKGESLGQTMTRIWKNITAAASAFWTGMKEAWMPLIDELSTQWQQAMTDIRMALKPLLDYFSEASDGVGVDWKNMGKIIVEVLGWIIKKGLTVITWLAQGIAAVASGFVLAGEIIGESIGVIVSNIGMLMNPIRALVAAFVEISDYMKWDVSDGLRKFAVKQDFDKGAWGKGREEREAAALEKKRKEASLQRKKDKAQAIIDAQNARENFQWEQGSNVNDLDGVIGKLEKIEKNTGSDKEIKVDMDGKKVGKGTAKNRQIDHERGGGYADAWQRARTFQHG